MMRFSWQQLLIALCIAGGIPATPVWAQDASQRRSVAALRDSLSRISDTLQLRAREQQILGLVRNTPQNGLLHLELGWVEMRLGDAGARRHFDNAATEFQYAADLQPTWPLAWFGLGMAELRVGALESLLPLSQRTRLREDATARATTALVKAAQLDATQVSTIVRDGLERTDPEEWRARGKVFLDIGRRLATVAAGRDSTLMMARVEVERNFGSRDSVVRLLEGFVSRAPRNANLLYRLGVAIFDTRNGPRADVYRTDGSVPWHLGLELADATLAAQYRADFATIANAGELAAFDRARGAERVRVIRQAFERRDRAELHASGERLIEHYRRLEFARRELNPSSMFAPPTHVASFLDPRGRLYVRQGAPTDRALDDSVGRTIAESWRYGSGDTAHVFHFMLPRANTGFQLAGNSANASSVWEAATDRMPLPFTVSLPGMARFYAIGGDGSHSEIQLVIGVPLAGIRPQATAGATRNSLWVRAQLLGNDGTSLAWVDTVRRLPAGVAGTMFYDRIPIRVASGSVIASVALIVDGAGVVVPPESLVVRAPKSGEPLLSDLAFGNRGVQLPWVLPGGDTAWVSPAPIFAPKAPIQIAFQVTGIPAGTSVSTEIQVRSPRRGLLRPILTAFLGNSTVYREHKSSQVLGGDGWILDDLGAAGLAPGEYTVQVTVTALGVKLTRQRALSVGP